MQILGERQYIQEKKEKENELRLNRSDSLWSVCYFWQRLLSVKQMAKWMLIAKFTIYIIENGFATHQTIQ